MCSHFTDLLAVCVCVPLDLPSPLREGSHDFILQSLEELNFSRPQWEVHSWSGHPLSPPSLTQTFDG